MTDLRSRVPAQALIEKVVSLQGTPDLKQLPLGIVKPSAEAMAWLRGIRGEQDAVRRLSRLGPEWTVVHSVPIGERDSDIDHLAVGPGGIFTINSKRHIDKNVWVAESHLRVNGQKVEHIRNAAFEAERVEKALAQRGVPVPVRAVVAVSGAKQITIKKPGSWKGRPVEVVDMGRLARLLTRQRVLDEQQIAQVVEHLVRADTWSTRALADGDVEELLKAYSAIDRGTGRWRAFLWLCMLAVIAAVIGVGLAFGGSAMTAFVQQFTG